MSQKTPAPPSARSLKEASLKRDAAGRELKLHQIEVKADAAKRTISGYASVFNNWDSYNDTIVPGAFKRTIAEKHDGRDASLVKFLWQHSWSDALGLPTVLREDSRGLEFEAKVIHPGELGQVALTLAAEKVVDGVSIGFNLFPGGYEWVDLDQLSEVELAQLLQHATLDDLWWSPPGRLTAIDLWEFSLVTFAANPDARVEVVKSLARTLVPGWSPVPAEQRAGRVLSQRNADALGRALGTLDAAAAEIRSVLESAATEEEEAAPAEEETPKQTPPLTPHTGIVTPSTAIADTALSAVLGDIRSAFEDFDL